MDKEKTGRLIKEARTEKGFTQAELGELVGVSNKAVSRWENGESFPDVALLDQLSQALDLKIEDIVLGEKQNTPENHSFQDIVQAVKLQKRQRRKQFYRIAAYLWIFVFILFVSFPILKGSSNREDIEYIVYLAIVLSVTTVMSLKELPAPPLDKSKKTVRLLIIVSLATGIYGVGLEWLVLWLFMKGGTFFHMEPQNMGPFVSSQVGLMYICNLMITVFYFWKFIREESSSALGFLLSETVMFLCLFHRDMLFRLDEASYTVLNRMHMNTVIMAAECLIAAVIVMFGRKKSR